MADRQHVLRQVLSLGSRAEQENEPRQIIVGNCSGAIWKPPSVSCAEIQESQKNMIIKS